jgi:hypothetical protein
MTAACHRCPAMATTARIHPVAESPGLTLFFPQTDYGFKLQT